MEYTTRPATQADYTYCYRLTKRNMLALFTRHWGGWKPSCFRKDFRAHTTTIILRAGRRAGYFSIQATEEEIYIENIQVSPPLQGSGMGTQLLEQIIATSRGKRIALTTFVDNPALRLYQRLGFRITQQKGETVRMARCR